MTLNTTDRPQLFFAHDRDRIPWPDSEIGQRAKDYLTPLFTHGVERYIENVTCQIGVMIYDDLALPVTISSKNWDDAYVCSVYTHYISYGLEELKLLPNPFLRTILAPVMQGFGKVIQATNLNTVVIVNNWLFSTNLYPNISEHAITAITRELQNKFPNHAILFRSINEKSTPLIFTNTKKSGYQHIASRQVYLWSDPKLTKHQAKNLRRDQALLDTTYTLTTLKESRAYAPRIAELYALLYLKKYSYHNPHFTRDFMRMVIDTNVFRVCIIHDHEKVYAVSGMFVLNNVLTQTVIGYDTELPREYGLYRRLSALGYLRAREWKCLAHRSSGAASFKRNRGCSAHIEYSAVYTKHLPFRMRFGWWLLRVIVNGVGIPIMKYSKL